MSAHTPLQLNLEDKLDALHYLDEFHFWYSLDDVQFCQCCGRRITGRQIVVVKVQGTRGKLQLQCPSAGCPSTPSDWVGPSIGKTKEKASSLEGMHHNGHARTVLSRKAPSR